MKTKIRMMPFMTMVAIAMAISFSCEKEKEEIKPATPTNDTIIPVYEEDGHKVDTSTGPDPVDIAFDGTNMWTANYSSNSNDNVSKVSPTGTITNYGLGGNLLPIAIAFDGTNMWTAHRNKTVTKITSNGTTTKYTLPGSNSFFVPVDIASDGTNMWVLLVAGGVVKVTSSGSMTKYPNTEYPSFGGNNTNAIAFDGTNMWAATDAGFIKITSAGAMTSFIDDVQHNAIAFDGTNMWAANSGGSATKITPAGVMTQYSGITSDLQGGIAFDGTNMWMTAIYNAVPNGTCGLSVIKVTPTGGMTQYFGTGEGPSAIAFDGTYYMWTANSGTCSGTVGTANSVTKISVK